MRRSLQFRGSEAARWAGPAALLALTACSAATPLPPAGAEGTWRISEIAGQPVLEVSAAFAHLPDPHLIIARAPNGDVRISGYGGCNRFSRSYDQAQLGAQSGLETTEMHCGEDMAVQEMNLFATLSGDTDFGLSADGQQLVLTGDDGKQVTARRVAAPSP